MASRIKFWLWAAGCLGGILVLLYWLDQVLNDGNIAVYIMKKLNPSFFHNNPCNLDYTGTQWNGLADPPSYVHGTHTFCSFSTAHYGLRAAGMNVVHIIRMGKTTYQELGETWAPASDNAGATDYGANLAKQLGKSETDAVEYGTAAALSLLLAAIVKNENSVCPYATTTLYDAALDALQSAGIA